jgi:hypothetical protein
MSRIFTETFESSEYDNANWSETTGTGRTVDGDDTTGPGGAGPRTGTYCLYCENVGYGGTVSYTTNDTDIADNTNPWYLRTYFAFNANTTDFADTEKFAWFKTNGNWTSFMLLENDGDVYKIYYRFYSTSDYQYHNSATFTVTQNTWYKIELHGNDTTNYWELKVDGVTIDSEGNHSSLTFRGDIDYIDLGLEGQFSGTPECEVWFDDVAINDHGWVEAPVYYSVSPYGTGDLQTEVTDLEITISDGVAVLTDSGGEGGNGVQTGNIGVGCEIEYNSIKCYISEVINAYTFRVITATGLTPANQAATDVTSIHHVFETLQTAYNSLDQSSYLNNSSFVSADVVVNLVCYADHDDQTAATRLLANARTMDDTHYLKIYTPNTAAECIYDCSGVGTYQRHDGKWNTDAFHVIDTYGSGVFDVRDTHVRLEGIQALDTYTGATSTFYFEHTSGEIYIEKCIAKGQASGAQRGIGSMSTGGTLYVSNNLVYDIDGTGLYLRGTGLTAYVYNNTVYGCSEYGVRMREAVAHWKNNIFYNNSLADMFETSGSNTVNYCLSSDSTANTWSGEGNVEDANLVFANSGESDFHLASGDTDARGAGTILSGESNYPISVDIDGETRLAWDIGADEFSSGVGTETIFAFGISGQQSMGSPGFTGIIAAAPSVQSISDFGAVNFTASFDVSSVVPIAGLGIAALSCPILTTSVDPVRETGEPGLSATIQAISTSPASQTGDLELTAILNAIGLSSASQIGSPELVAALQAINVDPSSQVGLANLTAIIQAISTDPSSQVGSPDLVAILQSFAVQSISGLGIPELVELASQIRATSVVPSRRETGEPGLTGVIGTSSVFHDSVVGEPVFLAVLTTTGVQQLRGVGEPALSAIEGLISILGAVQRKSAMGSPGLTASIAPPSVAGESNVGSPDLTATLTASGVGRTPVIGSIDLSAILSASSVSRVFGIGEGSLAAIISASSVDKVSVVGDPDLVAMLQAIGVPGTSSVGLPSISSVVFDIIRALSVAPKSSVGTPRIVLLSIYPAGYIFPLVEIDVDLSEISLIVDVGE